MKFALFLSCLLVVIHFSTQKSMVEDGCTEEMLIPMKEHMDHCFKITCSGGVAKIIACMNDICEPGKNPVGREDGDNDKMYPGCCGQLICE